MLRGNNDVAQEAKQEDVPSAGLMIKIQNPALDTWTAVTCARKSRSARDDGLHNNDNDVVSDAGRTRTSDPWDTRAPLTKGQAEPADMVTRDETL